MLRPPPRSPLFPSRRSSDLAFTGMVLGLQIYYTLRKFGSEGVLGSVVALSMIRELGPVLAALMVTARAGSAMTAEIGIMRITEDRKSTRLNSSHITISYAVFCLKKK